ncbi:PAS domain-containing protein [Coxiella endosymbiont of Ornithodoros maritimus]|uniref:PAS domain-containing protein n=1 Tax=Coxiella endosymbiont of Ornithodoros maritimus TaxID=1656172 RepID=UPI002263B1DF|nr:PAS domain-containing protein [Coxiella endosymbiont of Ornithodoros maritimus]
MEQLKAENFQLKHIVDNIPGNIYWKDRKGVWLGLNATASESLRKMGFLWKPNDVIGKTNYELFKKETADEFRKNDLEVMKKGKMIAREEVNIFLSGERISQLSTKRPLLDEKGNIVGIVGNTIDITRLKSIEAELRQVKEIAEQAKLVKTEFMRNMEHDIRTPFNGVCVGIG